MSKRLSRNTGHSELDEFQKFLGAQAAPYSDAQLQQLRREMHVIAEILFNAYMDGEQRRKDVDSRRSGSMLKPERSKNELPLG